MSRLSDMLVYLRKREGLSQQDLANRVGLTRSAIGMYETGKREPDLDTLSLLADFYRVDMNTLTGHAAMPTGRNGAGKWAAWNASGRAFTPESVQADALFCVEGDSMMGACIGNGDTVLIRLRQKIADGQIALVRVGGAYLLRRVFRREDCVELRAENPLYPPIFLREGEDYEVMGAAVAILRAIE